MHRGKLRELFPSTSFSGGVYLNDTGYDLLTRMLHIDPQQVSTLIYFDKYLFLIYFRELLLLKHYNTLGSVKKILNQHHAFICQDLHHDMTLNNFSYI